MKPDLYIYNYIHTHTSISGNTDHTVIDPFTLNEQ